MVSRSTAPELAVVVPVKDEVENLAPLIDEICTSLEGANLCFEIIYVDDGSIDATPALLADLMAVRPELRAIRHRKCRGQSAAIATGVAAASANLIATLDGDGQNDPADIPALLTRYREVSAQGDAALMIAGHRATRKDILLRRLSSRIANGVRGAMLKDDTPDTGCGLKIFPREAFMAMPQFDHMHRFLSKFCCLKRSLGEAALCYILRHELWGVLEDGRKFSFSATALCGCAQLRSDCCAPQLAETGCSATDVVATSS